MSATLSFGVEKAPNPAVIDGLTERPWRRHLPKICLGAADLGMIVVAMALAFVIKPLVPGSQAKNVETDYLILSVTSLPVWLFAIARYRLYRARNVASRSDEFVRILHAAF